MTRNRLFALALTVAAAAAAAVASLPAGAQTAQRCRDAANARGAKIVVQTKDAVAFTRAGRLRGCAFRTGTVRSIAPESGARGTAHHTLHGGYLAYVYSESNEFGANYEVRVYDLRRGRSTLREVTPIDDVEGGGAPLALVLRGPNTVAYVAEAFVQAGYRLEVHVIADGQDRVVDAETVANRDQATIAPRSLAIAENRTHAFWLHGGQPRAAELRKAGEI